MRQQLRFLLADSRRITNGRWWRWFGAAFSQPFAAVAFYRLDRGMWLTFGRAWPVMRLIASPFLMLTRPWVGCEIHYRADLGPGLIILHPSLGAVVSAFTVAGANLTLTGGNCIGGRLSARFDGAITLGTGVNVGVNAVVLGPVTIGDRATIGAHALVIDDISHDAVVVGSRARSIPDPNAPA